MAISVQITSPIKLLEYAKTFEEGNLTRIFVENMVAESDLLKAVPILPATNGKREFLDIASLPSTAFRAINEAASESSGSFNLREEDTFFIDQYVKVDRAVVDRLGTQHRFRQEKLQTTALSQMFSQQFIKSDRSSNARTPNGIQVRCSVSGTNLFNNTASSGGAALSLAQLDLLYWSVNKPTHWIFPRGLMPYVDAAARSSTLTNMAISYDVDPDFGHKITKFKGLPILFGYEPDDTPDLLPFTEVAAGGGSAVTASIYCVSLRDGGLYGIEQTPLNVMDQGEIIGQPFLSTHIKWDWGIAREHPRSVSRLTSITAATIVA